MPKLEADKALQFRALIAANLATVVAGELRTQRRAARLGGRTRLLTRCWAPPARRTDEAGLEALNRQLAAALRAGTMIRRAARSALEHLLATARETLEVTNPRFELAEDL